ncbi:MAG: hypothetical protein HYW34_01685 [Candidatus Brennerbacteria bacterium]|nr:hypothetical protein [Candidatus Brennerbacteria bacterium]
MFNKKSLIASILTFSLILSFGFIFWSYNYASAEQGSSDQNSVDDVDKIDGEKLSPSIGKFQLKGVISAVNVSSSQVSVNGLAINVSSDAKIRKADLRTLGDLAVDDRVEISGRIENGVLTAEKIVVKKIRKMPQAASGTISADVAKLRNDLQSRIADILKKIQELQNRINKQLPGGSGGAATSTP